MDVLPRVRKPGRYVGGELNAERAEWDGARLRLALCFPEVYEIGMSNLGFSLLYHLLNGLDGVLCERVFAPWTDMESELAGNGMPLYTLESFRALSEFDVVGFSLSYEMTYTNVLTMLKLGGLECRAADRGRTWPLVIAGGGCACNPEPMSDFIDVFVIGEGEAFLEDMVDVIAAAKEAGTPKPELLEKLAGMKGLYVPSMYDVEKGAGRVVVKDAGRGLFPVERRYVEKMDEAPVPEKFIVPWVEAVHDRIQLEVFRGCVQGCRYCQAGMIYRPFRARSAGLLVKESKSLYGDMGCDEVSLLSFNAPDYPEMGRLLDGLLEHATPNSVSVSMPSSRIDTFSEDVGEKLRRVRGTGLTLAPEAGTQRLRDVINKRITDEEILDAVRHAIGAGWKKIKLYFMIGLPTETMEDVEGIASLVGRIMNVIREKKAAGRKGKALTLSVSNFVPKPHTPFQWDAMDTMESLLEKQKFLRGLIDTRRVKLDFHDVRTSFLEGVMSRGDRSLGRVIEEAWKLGCRFDGWTEQFSFRRWEEAFGAAGIEPGLYANRGMEPLGALPWSHIRTGVTDKYLFLEYRKSREGRTTESCLRGACTGCGLGCELKDK